MSKLSPGTSLVALSFCVCIAIFALFPGIDLAVSALFYSPDAGFFYNRQGWPFLVHEAIPVIGTMLLRALAVAVVASFIFKPLAAKRRLCVFLLLSLLVGPVFVTNVVLKDHVGRPRPVEIQAFGGAHEFANVLARSEACQSNCSFVSGHAALAFFPCVLYVFYRRKSWMIAGLASGALVGAARVMGGKHFLSDVIFAFFVVYASAVLVAALIRLVDAAIEARRAPSWRNAATPG